MLLRQRLAQGNEMKCSSGSGGKTSTVGGLWTRAMRVIKRKRDNQGAS